MIRGICGFTLGCFLFSPQSSRSAQRGRGAEELGGSPPAPLLPCSLAVVVGMTLAFFALVCGKGEDKELAGTGQSDGDAYAEAELCYDRAVALSAQGTYREAIEHYKKAIEVAPDYVAAYTGLGDLYLTQGDYIRARRCYEKAIESDSSFGDAHYGLGLVFSKQGPVSSAVEEFEKVTEVAPGHAGAYSNLGLVYLARGRLSQAIEACTRAISIDPGLSHAHLSLGLVRLKQ